MVYVIKEKSKPYDMPSLDRTTSKLEFSSRVYVSIMKVLLSIKMAFYSVTFQDLFCLFIAATYNLFL